MKYVPIVFSAVSHDKLDLLPFLDNVNKITEYPKVRKVKQDKHGSWPDQRPAALNDQ